MLSKISYNEFLKNISYKIKVLNIQNKHPFGSQEKRFNPHSKNGNDINIKSVNIYKRNYLYKKRDNLDGGIGNFMKLYKLNLNNNKKIFNFNNRKNYINKKINTFRVINPNMNLDPETKYNIHKKKVKNKSWELKNDNIFLLFKNNSVNIKINRINKTKQNKSVELNKNIKKINNKFSFNFNDNNCQINNHNKTIRKRNKNNFNNNIFNNYLNNSMDKIRGRKHFSIIDHIF